MNGSQFQSKYINNTDGRFRTGQNRGIGSDDMRELVTDIKEFFLNLADGEYTRIRGIRANITSTADLKSVATASMQTGATVIYNDGGLKIYILEDNNTTESLPLFVRPNDFHVTTNPKIWRLSQFNIEAGGETIGLTKYTKPDITSISELKAIDTVEASESLPGLQVGTTLMFMDGNDFMMPYQLVSSTDAENLPYVIRPNDYAAVGNEKVWKRMTGDIIFFNEPEDFPATGEENKLYVAKGTKTIIPLVNPAFISSLAPWTNVGSGFGQTPEWIWGYSAIDNAYSENVAAAGPSATLVTKYLSQNGLDITIPAGSFIKVRLRPNGFVPQADGSSGYFTVELYDSGSSTIKHSLVYHLVNGDGFPGQDGSGLMWFEFDNEGSEPVSDISFDTVRFKAESGVVLFQNFGGVVYEIEVSYGSSSPSIWVWDDNITGYKILVGGEPEDGLTGQDLTDVSSELSGSPDTLALINNMRTRLIELESRLQSKNIIR